MLNPSSPKGGCTNPLTVFALVLKIAQPRGKIAPGTFKFTLSLHFSEKNSETTTYTGGRVSFQSWEVRGGWCDPVIFELDILKIFELVCTHKFVCKLEWPFFNIFCKNPMKIACFYDFLRKNLFLPIFYTHNGHFSIFSHYDVIVTSYING